MKSSDKAIFMGVGVGVLAILFYFVALAPKRKEASELKDQATELEAAVDQQNQIADFGEQARQHFPTYYGRLVVLGKAAPDQADSASMIVQLNSIANRTRVQFRGLELGQGAGGGSSSTSTTPATASTATTSGATSSGTTGGAAPTSTESSATPASSGSSTSGTSSSGSTGGETTGTSASPAPATEASAANLPIGAVVGPAGLPTLPYTLTFSGGFFDVSNFIAGVDDLVQMNHSTGQVAANGRLLTVDGFALKGGEPGSNPNLEASFVVTAYVVPSDQGLTAGASPTAPAPGTGQAQTTPTSGTVSP